jgi:hypothetical protein
MFHPVGSQPPSIYWRRRLVVLASVVALLVLFLLTVHVIFSSSSDSPAAADGSHSVSGSHTSQSAPNTHASTSKPADPSPRSSSGSKHRNTPPGGEHSSSSTAAPKPCPASALSLGAVTGKSAYSVGDQPVLSLQVTNKGPVACVVDLADPQIVLRVYNGESRVWGSHDCKVEPGTDDRTLMSGAAVKVSIVWSGLSSQPKCAGTRQRVGAGTYTLYGSLSGHEGKAAQFTLK